MSVTVLANGARNDRRRSGRARKVVDRYGKGDRTEQDSDDDGAEEDDASDRMSEDEEEEDDEDEPKQTKAAKRKRGPKGTTASKATGAKAASSRRKPKAAQAKGGALGDGQEGAPAATAAVSAGPGGKDFVINTDNTLFNAVKRGTAAYQTIAEDWIESYQQEQGEAVAELVCFFLRCCGCNATVDEHEAVDIDGVTSALETIQDEFKQAQGFAYPLISRSKQYKKFRSALDAFLKHLFEQAAGSEILYDDTFFSLYQEWIVSLSSSHVRAFRHTATVIGLATVSALCQVHLAVDAEFSQASRAKEAEEKKSRKDKAKLKDLEKIVAEVHKRKEALEDDLISIFDALFVHRYRDTEPLIRADCIKALGHWMRVDPEYFLEGTYLRYIGWVLSDDHKDVRHEAVRALIALYAKDDNIGTMSHFTERFKEQIVRMAVSEVDIAVRIASIGVLRSIESHGLLEPEQRDAVAQLIYSEEPRVRAAVAPFYDGLLDELVEERIAEAKTKPKDDDRPRLQLKALIELLLAHGKSLDGEDEMEVDSEDPVAPAQSSDVLATATKGRVAFAVEALYQEITIVRNWQAMLDVLVEEDANDGSSDEDEDSTPKANNARGARLSDEETTLLVEVFLASLSIVTQRNAVTKSEKEQEEEDIAEVSRTLIDALPKLFAKHQSFSSRIADILVLPRLISLSIYLDTRQITAYEQLWDNVVAQFMKHSDPAVTAQAVRTVEYLLAAATLDNTNDAKLLSLEESLAAALRETTDDRELDVCVFEPDELEALERTVARIDELARVSGHFAVQLDENDEGTKTPLYEIIYQISERAKLGYKDEERLTTHAVGALASNVKWQLHKLREDAGDNYADPIAAADLIKKSSALLARLQDFAVGPLSNVIEPVRQVSMSHLLEINILFAALTDQSNDAKGHFAELQREFGPEVQARCAGFIEALVSRYAETVKEFKEAESGESGDLGSDNSDSDSDEDESESRAQKKKKKAASQKKASQSQSQVPPKKPQELTSAEKRAKRARDLAKLAAESAFERAIAPFVRAIHFGLIDISHASVIVPYYEHFGAVFDQATKILVHDVRDEALYGASPDSAVKVVVESLKTACELNVASEEDLSDKIVALGRLLSSAIVLRGAMLKVVKQLTAARHGQLHIDLINWTTDRISRFEGAQAKRNKEKTVAIFKALTLLVFGLSGTQALKVNNALTAALEKHSIEVPTTVKTWEPLRSYQKRLVTAMSKDANIKAAAKARVKNKGKGKDKAATDDEGSADEVARDEEAPRSAAKKQKQKEGPETTADPDDVDELPQRRQGGHKRAGTEIGSLPKRRRTSPLGSDNEGGPAGDAQGSDEEAGEADLAEDVAAESDEDNEVLAQLSQAGSVASLSDVKQAQRRARPRM